MKTNELRIGNYVLFNNKTKTVDLSDFGTEWTGDLGRTIFKEFKPIPVNKEWLSDLDILTDSKFDYKENVAYVVNNKCYYVIDTYYDSNDATCYVEIEIDFVHELQNLHFSLTGEELKLASGARSSSTE
ncbi:hypothetical protein [Mesonia sp. HuA40]|uniref:hypothetical protein n=1 Tax=Mesonia sp. HuA40 TaxID=2602761 RepID=UPI0011CAAD3A|nr:hypothetical protein [Mesonia sp. HuA40]TXK73933.1 hypothetical protein FT993_03480 [Mesonia sp. HuA40]